MIVFIDLFCGAGGVTTGVHQARHEGHPIVKVIACVNHDPKAIMSHATNYPDCKHYTEDIRTLDVSKLPDKEDIYYKYGYDTIIVLWASLECTNFSNAKGGKPRDADSRTLAEHLYRYIDHIDPDYVYIENVREFMAWGPLDEKGKPVNRVGGIDYLRWKHQVESMGYRHDWRLLNSANYGAYTSRLRYFGVFAKHGLPISFPEATHSKEVSNNSIDGRHLKKWKPVKEVLDFSDEGISIFGRKIQLSPKTLQRIYAGLIKYVAGGKDAFIAKYYSGRPEGKVIDLDGPAGTVTTADGQSIVRAFVLKYLGNNEKTGINNGLSIEDPAPVITTQNRLAIVNPSFLLKYYKSGENIMGLDEPASTLTTKDRLAVVNASWLDLQFSNGKRDQSIEQPLGSITTIPKSNLAQAFMVNPSFNNDVYSIDEPSKTLLACRKHHYLVNPQWFGNNGSIDSPCCTLIARQDKSPMYLVSTDHAQVVGIMIEDSDSEEMIKIKEFMVLYNIVDIKMRMLKVSELKKIQGFPDDYYLAGNQTDQKKFIGNSVVPVIPKRLMECLYQHPIIQALKQAA